MHSSLLASSLLAPIPKWEHSTRASGNFFSRLLTLILDKSIVQVCESPMLLWPPLIFRCWNSPVLHVSSNVQPRLTYSDEELGLARSMSLASEESDGDSPVSNFMIAEFCLIVLVQEIGYDGDLPVSNFMIAEFCFQLPLKACSDS